MPCTHKKIILHLQHVNSNEYLIFNYLLILGVSVGTLNSKNVTLKKELQKWPAAIPVQIGLAACSARGILGWLNAVRD
jgi:hypothetical protein